MAIDYIGLADRAHLGFQIMLDRGEDDDWFGSALIRASRPGGGGRGGRLRLAAVCEKARRRSARAQRPEFRARLLAIASFAVILYGSAVLVPQLAQQQLGYTALLAGLC